MTNQEQEQRRRIRREVERGEDGGGEGGRSTRVVDEDEFEDLPAIALWQPIRPHLILLLPIVTNCKSTSHQHEHITGRKGRRRGRGPRGEGVPSSEDGEGIEDSGLQVLFSICIVNLFHRYTHK